MAGHARRCDQQHPNLGLRKDLRRAELSAPSPCAEFPLPPEHEGRLYSTAPILRRHSCNSCGAGGSAPIPAPIPTSPSLKAHPTLMAPNFSSGHNARLLAHCIIAARIVMTKETRIGYFTYFEKIMFNASILFKTTTRVIILNILTT